MASYFAVWKGRKKMATKANFETSMARLDEIVSLLEKGDKSLEESMTLFEEGTKLMKQCNTLLDKAEQKVMKLVAESGNEPKEVDFSIVEQLGL